MHNPEFESRNQDSSLSISKQKNRYNISCRDLVTNQTNSIHLNSYDDLVDLYNVVQDMLHFDLRNNLC